MNGTSMKRYKERNIAMMPMETASIQTGCLQVGCPYKFPMTPLNALIDSKNKIIEKQLDKYGLLL